MIDENEKNTEKDESNELKTENSLVKTETESESETETESESVKNEIIPFEKKELAENLEMTDKNSETRIEKTKSEKKKRGKKGKIFITAFLFLLVLFIVFNVINIVKYNIEISNFKSFDLEALNRKEFVIQTIEFKKFLVQGTEEKGEYTDELQIYHISGRAEISFTGMDKLTLNKNDCDFSNKIMRLKYDNSDGKMPFAVSIIINEGDIQKVAALESKEMNIFGFKTDLIKPEMSQGEILNSVKKELEEEFRNQVIGENSLSESEIYQTFLKRFSEMVKKNSNWEIVEIAF